ncbi:MAG: hypothetical protein LBK56_02070 [Gracilibacteraceae bacterium]|jgi:hypothetical protein|nr:hypothetical protein [Gracilibacteraceae bacterium]
MLSQIEIGTNIVFINDMYEITAGTEATINKVDYKTGKVEGLTAEGQKFQINYFDTKSSFRIKLRCMTGAEVWEYLTNNYDSNESRKIALEMIKESGADDDSQRLCYELREAVKKSILAAALARKGVTEQAEGK